MSSIAGLDIEEAANQAAGNWQKFDSFVWWRARELERPEDFTVYYTHHRDSGLLDQSNHVVISKAMEKFMDGDDPDVIVEDHSHWAVGWIKGFAVRVFDDNGEITDAYRCLHELQERMADFPILDESLYSEMEYEASFENIDLAAWRLKREFDLPEDWQSSVFDWLWQHRDHALENVDDNGGWPDEEDLQAAFDALGYARVE
jgi:hypothetical protein